MRHLEEAYGDQVLFGFVMGGLVRDISNFSDPRNKIGGAKMAEQVAVHWREASEKHGMPVDADVWLDMKDEFRSTWPANIAVKAAQMQDEAVASTYLRRLREAAAAEHIFIHRREVQMKFAGEAGLDPARFEADLDNGGAERAFMEDMRMCRERHVTGFPSFLLQSHLGEEAMLSGFQPFDRFETLFKQLCGDELKAREILAENTNIIAFVRKYRSVAVQEVAEVFSLERQQAEERLRRLVKENLISSHSAGNGALFHAL